jgi:hypothetical protein
LGKLYQFEVERLDPPQPIGLANVRRNSQAMQTAIRR